MLMAPIPAVRQKRSKELSTSCQAVLRLGASASDEGVVIVVMALLPLRIDTPSLTAQGGQRLIQQWPGQSPAARQFEISCFKQHRKDTR
jgi:hypothetical protein